MKIKNKVDINEIINTILNGELVILKTDTIYGIIADATNKESIQKVYEVKQRSYDKPLIILISDLEMLNKYTRDINELEYYLIKKYWPGPLTMILKKSTLVNNMITSNLDTVGIRYPKDENLLEIIRKLNRPIISTSANISNEDNVININLIDESIKSKVKYIYDSGEINKVASTIIKVDNNKINILRNGCLEETIKNEFKNYI